MARPVYALDRIFWRKKLGSHLRSSYLIFQPFRQVTLWKLLSVFSSRGNKEGWHDVAIPVTVYMMSIKMRLYRCLFALLLYIYQSVNVLIYRYVSVIFEYRYNLHLSHFICSAAFHNIKHKNKLSN